MSTRRIIFGLIVCFSIAVFVGQTLSQTRGRTRTSKTTDRDRWLREQQRMADQRRRLNEERVAKQMMEFKQRVKDMHDGRDERRNQSIKQRLEATEEQWKVIEPKINRIYFFRNQSSISMGFGGAGGGYSGGSAQYWAGPPWRLADRPLTEGEKACEELSELLQDKNSDPEKIKQKMVALRQAREKARNQLAKVRQELREILNSRQEAKLVLLEVLD
jgi:hypothetical protein